MFTRLTQSVFTILTLFLFLSSAVFAAPPANFSRAKVALKEQVYFDQNQGEALGTAYCGCNWEWVGKSGGRTDLASCGYKIRSPQSKHMVTRAERTEWEHVYAASHFGQQRQCWKREGGKGGRANCQRNDPVFNLMEADMHNLTPIIGEVNADRSNYPIGMVSSRKDGMYGHCASKTDFKQRVFEPRDEAKGMVARIHFYMTDRYNLSMSRQQQQLFQAWNKQFPPSEWEFERNSRIAKVMGHSNEFVTGERTWTLSHKNKGDGVVENSRVNLAKGADYIGKKSIKQSAANDSSFIHGNRNSKIYHLNNCPNYNSMSPKNVIEFKTEQEAKSSGFRKAKNCP